MMKSSSDVVEQGYVSTLSLVFRVGIVFGIFASLFHVLSIIDDGSSSILVGDAIINFTFGMISYMCYKLLERRDNRVIIIAGISLVIFLAYSLIVGRGFNFIMLIFWGLVLVGLFDLNRRGYLSSRSKV